jgi:hypothetical protein
LNNTNLSCGKIFSAIARNCVNGMEMYGELKDVTRFTV